MGWKLQETKLKTDLTCSRKCLSDFNPQTSRSAESRNLLPSQLVAPLLGTQLWTKITAFFYLNIASSFFGKSGHLFELKPVEQVSSYSGIQRLSSLMATPAHSPNMKSAELDTHRALNLFLLKLKQKTSIQHGWEDICMQHNREKSRVIYNQCIIMRTCLKSFFSEILMKIQHL